MTKRQWVGISIALIILVILVVSVAKWDVGKPRKESSTVPKNQIENTGEREKEEKSSETYTSEVPKNKELTPGVVEVPAAPGAKNEKLRVFNVSITKDGYNPREIVVNGGDTVNLNIKAEGGDFDLAIPDIGLYHSIANGETKVMAFQALVSGVFTFLCKEQCPAGKVIKGSLIVK